MTFSLMRRETSANIFSGGESTTSWLLMQTDLHITEHVGTFATETVARRVADLLNRHGVVDVPMPEEMGL